MRTRKFNWELVVGVCGIALGLISLVFTYYQIELSKRHDRISVQPRITLAFHSDSKRGRYGWYLSNNGLGPAYFTGFKLFVDDEPIGSTALGGWKEVLTKLDLRGDCFSTSWTAPETSLSFGPEVDEPLIGLKTPISETCETEFTKLMTRLNRLKVQIDYQSIYGEPFQKIAQPTQLF
ncbi:hypothetical protein [Thauera sp.]|uniref:hypothetical protein n=1 Tax=Thauera sp. TaxID=1905334 RepID=UPI0039E322EA